MFSKLLKHEWKANSGLLGILSLCALGVGALGAGILRIMIYLEERILEDDLAGIAVSGLSSMMVFVVIALIAYALAVQFINLYRFYKNKFTDEGYLTFTLPVTPRQIFLSSFLVILAWMAISVFVLICAVFLIIVVGMGEPLREALRAMENISQDVYDIALPGAELFFGLSFLQILVSPVYAIVLLMTSITLGCVLAKKYKILATIGMYYCINMVVNIISTILSFLPTIALVADSLHSGPLNETSYMYNMAATVGVNIVLQIGLILGGYFWSTHLMKHKLNLP